MGRGGNRILVVDDREVTQHPDIPELLGDLQVYVMRMEAADYSFLNRDDEPTGIERCEIGNLLQKIRSGELESQLIHCDENYSNVILLVEGVYDGVAGFLAHYRKSREGNAYYRNRIEPNFRYTEVKALEIRLSELGIELIETANFSCSMDCIRTIYLQRTKPEEQHSLFKKIRVIKIPVKISADPAVPRLMVLCNRMGEKVAVRLIHKYNSIWEIAHASDTELLEIEGMGAGLLQNLKRGLGKP